MDLTVKLPRAHDEQRRFIQSPAKRKVIRAGRRSGKTVGMAILAVRTYLAGKRVLYATPTSEQIDRFWYEVKMALGEPLEQGVFYKNETRHIIERLGTEQRIRAKTAWNADSLRGDYADLLILDEWQLMSEDAWDKVGAPMLLDNDGDAAFVYTPPSPHSRSASKATDPMHAAKLYKRAAAKQEDGDDRWAVFNFSSRANPFISQLAIDELAQDMTAIAYRMEILAEDLDDVPGALWTRAGLDTSRLNSHPDLYKIIVGVDPAASTGQTGIVVAGVGLEDGAAHGYTLEDVTTPAGSSPATWASAAVAAYHKWKADVIIGEVNNGGDMIEHTIRTVPDGGGVNYQTIRATRGKYTRAEPIASIFETDAERNKLPRGHMVGYYELLEDELCTYVPGDVSPNRLDAMVWAYTELGLSAPPAAGAIINDLDMSIYRSKRSTIWD